MKKLIKRLDSNNYTEFLGKNVEWALKNGYSYENFEINVEEEKEKKLIELRQNVESIFYNKYPLYKQNNIAIFGTEEEKEEFKLFYDTVIAEYELEKKKLENDINIEQKNK